MMACSCEAAILPVITHYISQSLDRVRTDPGKSWKVLELKCGDFQAWKVLEKGIGPGKVLEF